jgi:hypothetical protein
MNEEFNEEEYNEIGNEEEIEDVYDEEGAEELEEAEEIDEIEEGFMKGYTESTDPTKCAQCGKLLEGEDIVEREIKDETYYFCSQECADEFESRKQ